MHDSKEDELGKLCELGSGHILTQAQSTFLEEDREVCCPKGI